LAPRNLCGLHLSEDFNGVSVHHQLSVLGFNGSLEASVGGVVLGEVHHVFEVDEGIVDGNHLDVISLKGGPEDEAPDSSESI